MLGKPWNRTTPQIFPEPQSQCYRYKDKNPCNGLRVKSRKQNQNTNWNQVQRLDCIRTTIGFEKVGEHEIIGV